MKYSTGFILPLNTNNFEKKKKTNLKYHHGYLEGHLKLMRSIIHEANTLQNISDKTLHGRLQSFHPTS